MIRFMIKFLYIIFNNFDGLDLRTDNLFNLSQMLLGIFYQVFYFLRAIFTHKLMQDCVIVYELLIFVLRLTAS